MIWFIAWRNIWRNRIRSSVVLAAIAIGLFGGTFAAAVMNGMVLRRIDTAIQQEVSHLQFSHPDFAANKDPEFTIPQAEHLLDSLATDPHVHAYSPRLVLLGMASTARKNAGVEILAIDPESEARVSTLDDLLVDSASTYFSGSSRLPVLVGKQLADKLNLRVGSKLLLTTQGADGYQTGGSFRVVGIFRSSNSVFNESKLFVRRTDLAAITGLDAQAAHQVAVLLKQQDQAPERTKLYAQQWPTLHVQSYLQLAPDLALTAQYLDVFMLYVVAIVLMALGFGIVNTMLMVVLERVKEIGMLMAIGMTKARIFLMILLETVYLLAAGGAVGMGISHTLIVYFGKHGIALHGYAQGFESLGYSAVLYPQIGWVNYLSISLLVVLTGIAASVYPALKAIRLKPSEALATA